MAPRYEQVWNSDSGHAQPHKSSYRYIYNPYHRERFTDGWGHASVDLKHFLQTAKSIATIGIEGRIFHAFILLSLVTLAFGLAVGISQSMAYIIAGDTGAGFIGAIAALFAIILFPLTFILSILQYSLARPYFQTIFSPTIFDNSIRHIFASALDVAFRVGLALVVLVLAIGLGLIFLIIPGILVAFFFGQAPYLVATQKLSLKDAAKQSYRRAKRHWPILLTAMILGFSIMLPLSLFIYAPLNFLVSLTSPFNAIAMPILEWGYSLASGLLVFWLSITAFAAIDEIDNPHLTMRGKPQS